MSERNNIVRDSMRVYERTGRPMMKTDPEIWRIQRDGCHIQVAFTKVEGWQRRRLIDDIFADTPEEAQQIVWEKYRLNVEVQP